MPWDSPKAAPNQGIANREVLWRPAGDAPILAPEAEAKEVRRTRRTEAPWSGALRGLAGGDSSSRDAEPLEGNDAWNRRVAAV